MTLYRQGAMGKRETRTQEAPRARSRVTPRRRGALGECGARTQGAPVAGGHGRDGGRRIRAVQRNRAAEVSCWSEFQQAALRARPRTPYRAVQCVLVAKASIFNSLLGTGPP
jgi:hypothetical protein